MTDDNYSTVFEWTSAQYREINDLYTAIEVLEDAGLIQPNVKEDITGFRLIPAEGKAELVNMPFLIVSATLKKAIEHGSTYVDIMLVTADDQRIWMRDSSTGIFAQLQERFTAAGTTVLYGLWVRRGLRFQDFPFKRDDGQTINSRTYYLNSILPRFTGDRS